MHRVQRVDYNVGVGDGQTGVEGAPAKAVQQRDLAVARETGFGQPRAKLGKTRGDPRAAIRRCSKRPNEGS